MASKTRISFQGPPCDDEKILRRIPGALRSLIETHNGFVSHDGAFHLRGACSEPRWHSLREAWLAPQAVMARAPGLSEADIPFAETAFGDQLYLREHDVLRLRANTEIPTIESLGMSLGGLLRALEGDVSGLLGFDSAAQSTDPHTREREGLLDCWFGDSRNWDGDEVGDLASHSARWFAGGAHFDATLDENFAALLARAEANELGPSWQSSPRDAAAAVLVLDQLPRNLRRGSAAAFGLDEQALALCKEILDAGFDQRMHPLEAAFSYLPLEHSESLVDQKRCVALFEALVARAPSAAGPIFEGFVDFARRHRSVIERFGRFPHRNSLLGRPSSDEEQSFLADGGESFDDSKETA
jgi:uncharacterized protein (DUF924 family)